MVSESGFTFTTERAHPAIPNVAFPEAMAFFCSDVNNGNDIADLTIQAKIIDQLFSSGIYKTLTLNLNILVSLITASYNRRRYSIEYCGSSLSSTFGKFVTILKDGLEVEVIRTQKSPLEYAMLIESVGSYISNSVSNIQKIGINLNANNQQGYPTPPIKFEQVGKPAEIGIHANVEPVTWGDLVDVINEVVSSSHGKLDAFIYSGLLFVKNKLVIAGEHVSPAPLWNVYQKVYTDYNTCELHHFVYIHGRCMRAPNPNVSFEEIVKATHAVSASGIKV